MARDSRIDLLARLTTVTGQQIVAARQMDTAALDRLNALHADLLFQLEVAFVDPVPEDEGVRQELKAQAAELVQARERLARLTSTVVQVLDRVLPSRPPPTYGKRGRLST